MKKFLAWPIVVGLLLATPLLFAQNSLAESYRAQMLPMFLDYIQIGSMSDNDAEWMTPGQEEMAARLEQDIQQLIHGQKGFHLHVSADKYLYINIDSNLKKKNIPVLGISAHYDTTPDINGMGIKGRVIHNYDGGIINLTPNETDPEKQKVIDPDTDPYLSHVVGQTIVVADTNGTTNLGADDKAGLTIVMTLLKTLVENPSLPHGPIDIVLAPNEDVGRAAERIELDYYAPDYAFDFDGETNNEVIVENFTAEKILVTVHGINGHQSYAATNGYRNSSAPVAYIIDHVAMLENLPNYSQGDEGYIEPHHISYNAENNTSTIDFRLRYFDREQGKAWKERLLTAVTSAMVIYDVKINVDIILQYDNVANGVKPEAKEILANAMNRAGLIPNFKKERAGTTSAMIMAQLGFGGYTVFTGQVNPHAFTEWLSEEDMFKSYEVALNLVQEMIQHKQ